LSKECAGVVSVAAGGVDAALVRPRCNCHPLAACAPEAMVACLASLSVSQYVATLDVIVMST